MRPNLRSRIFPDISPLLLNAQRFSNKLSHPPPCLNRLLGYTYIRHALVHSHDVLRAFSYVEEVVSCVDPPGRRDVIPARRLTREGHRHRIWSIDD